MTDIAPLREFVVAMTDLLPRHQTEQTLLPECGRLLAALIAADDWLAEDYAVPNPDSYRQYLLHCDPLQRFSVVSFVWGPGQETR